MNRPIQFRVWDKIAKTFHAGNVAIEDDGTILIWLNACYQAPENPSRLIAEQWTGLLDIKGNKIFQGDIVDFEHKESTSTGNVTVKDRGAVAYQYCYFTCGEYKMFVAENIEVIGNVHENPELLTN